MSSRRTSLFQAKSGSRRTTVVTSSSTTSIKTVGRFQSPTSQRGTLSPVGSPLTPGWISGKVAVFLSPKSISPPQNRRTHRSVYVKKNVVASKKTSSSSGFNIPMTKVFSPPGVKTRFRRASMYVQQGRKAPLQSSPLSVREMAAIVRSTSLESEEEEKLLSSPKRKTSRSQKGPSRKRSPSPVKRRIVKARKGSKTSKTSPKASKKASTPAESEKETVTTASSRSSRGKGSKGKTPGRKGAKGSKSPSPKISAKAGRSAKKRPRGKAATEDEEDSEEGSPAPKSRRVQASTSSESSSKRSTSKSAKKTPASTRSKRTSVKSTRSIRMLANLTDSDGFLAMSPQSISRTDSSSPKQKLKFPKKFVKDLLSEFKQHEDISVSPVSASTSPVRTPRRTPANRSPKSSPKSKSTKKISRSASAKPSTDFSIESHSSSEDEGTSSVAKIRKSNAKSPSKSPKKAPRSLSKKVPKSPSKKTPQSKSPTPSRLSRRSTGKTSSSRRSSSVRSGSTKTLKLTEAAGKGDTPPSSLPPKKTSSLSRTSTNRVSIGSTAKRSSSSSTLVTSSGKRRTPVSAKCLLNKNSNSSSSLQGLSSSHMSSTRSPLSRRLTSSTKKRELETSTSFYRTPEKFSPPALLAGQKRKTVLTPFYDSLSAKRRDLGRARDYVDSPLISGSPVARQATRASLSSSKRTVVTSFSRLSSSRHGGSRKSLLNSGEDEEDMTMEIEEDGDGVRELPVKQSKSWCSVM